MREILLAIFLVATCFIWLIAFSLMAISGFYQAAEPSQVLCWIEIAFFTGLLGYGIYCLAYFIRRE